jgi:hypothetical protein
MFGGTLFALRAKKQVLLFWLHLPSVIHKSVSVKNYCFNFFGQSFFGNFFTYLRGYHGLGHFCFFFNFDVRKRYQCHTFFIINDLPVNMCVGTEHGKSGPGLSSNNFGSYPSFSLTISFCFNFFASHMY